MLERARKFAPVALEPLEQTIGVDMASGHAAAAVEPLLRDGPARRSGALPAVDQCAARLPETVEYRNDRFMPDLEASVQLANVPLRANPEERV